jgi:hypothetical protein
LWCFLFWKFENFFPAFVLFMLLVSIYPYLSISFNKGWVYFIIFLQICVILFYIFA